MQSSPFIEGARALRSTLARQVWIVLLILVTALPGPVVLLAATWSHGLTVMTDSVQYISASDSFRTNGTMVTSDGSVFAHWPPLLPFLIAAGTTLSLSPVRSALLINLLSWTLTSFISGFWTLEVTSSRILGVAVSLAVSCSVALFAVSSVALSESLFSFLTVLSLWLLYQALTVDSERLVATAGAACAGACLTRYIGFVLLGVEIVALLILETKQRRLRRAVLFLVYAALPFLLWLTRNYLLADSAFTDRGLGAQSLSEVVFTMGQQIGSWFLPRSFFFLPFVAAALGLFYASRCLWILGQLHRRKLTPLELSVLLLGAYSLGYIAAIALASITTDSCCVGGRLEAPIFACFVTGLALCLYQCIATLLRARAWSHRWANGCALMLLLASTGLAIPKTLYETGKLAEEGPGGFTDRQWVASEGIAYARAHLTRAKVFSNVPEVIYLVTGIRATYTPAKGAFKSSARIDGRPAFVQAVMRAPNAYVIWFNRGSADWRSPDWLFNPDDFRDMVKMELVAHLSDSDIYVVGPR